MLETQYRMTVAMNSIPEYLLYHNEEDLSFPLTFVPPQLQNLFFRLLEKNCITIDSIDGIDNDKDYLSYGHILVECLMALSNASCKRLSLLGALVALLPMLRTYRLENFGSSLLWTLPERDSSILQRFETSKQYSMDRVETFPPGFDMTDEGRQRLIKEYIKQEHMRFRNALIENDGKSMKLYATCISLARICKWAPEARKLHLLEESIRGAMIIESKLMRLDALSVILLYSHSDYHRITASKDRSLQKEIEYQLNVIFPDLPILLQTTMFIRCLPLLEHQATIESCLGNLRHKLMHADQQDRQVVYAALSPYFESNSTIVPWKQHLLDDSLTKYKDVDYNKIMNRRSSILRECFTKDPYNNVLNDSLSLPLLLSDLYLVELGSDLHGFIENNDHWLRVPRSDTMIRDESIIVAKLFHLRSSTLTVTQASTITHLLSSNVSLNRLKYSKKFWFALNDELHRLNLVEFKACRLLECWMKWKDSNELSLLAFQAALLLTQSDFWSVEAATLVCDLLSHENDRFRQKAEVILRSKRTRGDRTSSRLDIDVLLILTKKMAHFQHTSPFAKLTLSRMFNDITIDIRSHLETFLWLERYRIHALVANRTLLHKLNVSPVSSFVSYFPSDMAINVSFCGHIRNISGDSQQFMCELIESNFASFLDIGGDVTSKLVLESHIQFVVSVIVSLATLSAHDDHSRSLRLDALVACIEKSRNLAICQAAAYAVGYILDQETYKIVFKKLQIIVKKAVNETSHHSDPLISALISSYCHFIAVSGIDFDQDDIDLFRQLLKYSSSIILKEVHVGLARVLKEKSMLLEMLDSNHIQCFHALIGSTAYFFKYEVQERCAKNTAEFVEENPALLSVFVAELYNSIRHFTKDVVYRETTENILAYGYPQYVEVASLIAVQMPAAFISCIKECGYEDELKRSLFYTSKQHDFPRRGACLTIFSIFGELTVELCEMFIEGLCHDLHMQKICNTCLTRINTIKGQNAVLNLLFSYLKSKSMIVRYAATKMLLHFSRSSVISFDQVRSALDGLMSDPTSEEDLWLIDEHEDLRTDSVYYCVGSLKDVIYCLLIQRLTGDTSRVVQSDELNNIDLDFIQSEKASNLASCLYEEKRDTDSRLSPPSHYKSDHDKKTWAHEESTYNGHVVEQVIANDEMERKTMNEGAQSPVIGVDMYSSQPPSRNSTSQKKPSTLCVLI